MNLSCDCSDRWFVHVNQNICFSCALFFTPVTCTSFPFESCLALRQAAIWMFNLAEPLFTSSLGAPSQLHVLSSPNAVTCFMFTPPSRQFSFTRSSPFASGPICSIDSLFFPHTFVLVLYFTCNSFTCENFVHQYTKNCFVVHVFIC